MALELNRRTFRFKPAHDVLLLREITRHRPWTAAHGETMAAWDTIGESFNAQLALVRPGGPEIDAKACQRRYKALIDSYLSGDIASLRSTGSADEVNEREQLVADLHQVTKDYRSDRSDRRASRSSVSETGGFESYTSPASDVNAVDHNKRRFEQQPNGSPLTKKQRPIVPTAAAVSANSTAAWDFLHCYLQDESTRRQQELRLAEQKMEIEKQRFELEKRERESHISTMTAQLELIKQLVSQLQQTRA